MEVSELSRSLDAPLVAALDGAPQTAARAALAIGRTKNAAGIAPLEAHLNNSDERVRAMCAYGLGLLTDANALPQLRRMMRSTSESSAVRYAAADAIGRILSARPSLADRGTASDLEIVASPATLDPWLRGHAVIQLEVFRETPFAKDVANVLQRLETTNEVHDTDGAVRWHAAWTLFRGFATLADAKFLERQLHDKNTLVRVETARAWGRRSDPNAVAIVTPALDDPSWQVQLEAREALRRLAKQPPTDHLVEDPPGLHLPPLPPQHNLPLPVSPMPSGTQAPLAAPDPYSFALEDPAMPTTANGMDIPRTKPHPYVVLRTTKGDVEIRLFREWAPSTVANFLQLVNRHYFDNNRWFRIVPDFVVQTGDKNDNGEGDPGYNIPAEENPIEQRSNVIAMGLNYTQNRPDRDSAATQFYITLSPQLHLNRDFTVFGEVSDGQNVLAHLVESDRILAAAYEGDR